MTVEVARTKQRRHVTAYENATCHTHVHVRACECVCVRLCARVYMNNEIAPLSRFCLSHYVLIPYLLTHALSFFYVGLCFLLLSAQVAWPHMECSIA